MNYCWMKCPTDRWTTPEAALLAYRAKGHPDAVRALFDLTAPTLFRVALSSAPDASSAEDVLQETYIAFLAKLDTFERGQPVMPWLLGILRNRTRRAGRAAARRPDPRRLPLRERTQPDHAPDELSRVREAIEALAEPYRSVALMHHIYGLEPAEIAHVQDRPPGTVRSQLHRARERLSSKLRPSLALLWLGDPVRSLAAVREAVVATAVGPAAAGALLLGGTLIMKKVLALAALAALLILGAVVVGLPGGESGVAGSAKGPASNTGPVKAPKLMGTTLSGVNRDAATAPEGPHAACRVVDTEGVPVSGARLVAMPTTSKMGRDPFGTSVQSALSDSTGHGFVQLGRDAPSFFLYAEAKGLAPSMAHIVRAGDDVVVTLARATALTGVVRNRDGEVVPGAQVEILAMVGAASRRWRVRADGTGTYRIEGLPVAVQTTPSGTMLGCWIRLVADGYAPSTTMHEVTVGPGETQTRDVYLLRGVTVRGQVVLSGGDTPVAGAHVVLAPSGNSRGRMMVFGHEVGVPFEATAYGRLRADAGGRFTFKHAPYAQGRAPLLGGGPVVYAWSAGTCLGSVPYINADDEGEVEVKIELHPAAVVTGRLVDASGAAVREARVWIRTSGLRAAPAFGVPTKELPRSSGRTDARGMFRLEGVPARAGAQTPATFASGERAHVGASFTMLVERNIEVEGGVVLDLGTLVCRNGTRPEDQEARTSRLRVVDVGGRPVWGAAVGHAYTNLMLRTDREGRTAITWGGSGAGPVSMLVRVAGFATRRVQVSMGGAEQTVEITRVRATLLGTVIGPSGEPIVGAFIEVAHESVSAGDAFPVGRNHWQTSRFVVGTAATDREGRFAVNDLAPGSYRLRAQSTVRSATGQAPNSVVVSGLETSAVGIEVHLPIAPALEGGRVEVRIVDARTGRSVIGAMVSVRAGGRTLYGRGDVPGRRVITSVAAGEATLTVAAAGYVSHERLITVRGAAQSQFEALLVPGAGLKGRAVLPVPKEQRPMYSISLFPTTGALRTDPAYRVHIGADGSFSTRGLEAGRYYIVARRRVAKAGEPQVLVPRSPFLDIPEQGTVERSFVFEIGGTLSVRPSDSRLPPKPWGVQAATPEQARFGRRSWMLLKDAGGNHVMRHEGVSTGFAGTLGSLALRPGRYTLHVKYANDDVREISVTIEAGGERVVSP